MRFPSRNAPATAAATAQSPRASSTTSKPRAGAMACAYSQRKKDQASGAAVVAAQTGAVRRTVETAGRKNALAARSESMLILPDASGFSRHSTAGAMTYACARRRATALSAA